jgi:hypothetical protein
MQSRREFLKAVFSGVVCSALCAGSPLKSGRGLRRAHQTRGRGKV